MLYIFNSIKFYMYNILYSMFLLINYSIIFLLIKTAAFDYINLSSLLQLEACRKTLSCNFPEIHS